MKVRQLGLRKFQTGFWRLLPMLSSPLMGIFNQSLVTSIFPSDWKLAKCHQLLRIVLKADLHNYRQISVIPTVAKIFEKIIYDQLYNYLNASGRLNSG